MGFSGALFAHIAPAAASEKESAYVVLADVATSLTFERQPVQPAGLQADAL